MWGTVVFAVEDWTSYRALAPVADALSDEANVEFLFADALYDGIDVDVDLDEARRDHEGRDIDEYVRGPTTLFGQFPGGPARAFAQKLLADDLSHRLAYDVEGYLDGADPDVFVCGMDSLPFVRHVIRAAHDRDVATVALQHGLYCNNLDPEKIEQRYGPLSPVIDPDRPSLERLKRWFGFRYGIGVYCHPHLDLVLTMGEFFTERIAELRSSYPCFGNAELSVTGTPEYERSIEPYEPDAESVLFLSQPQYENGDWTREQQRRAVSLLDEYTGDVPVTIRPHPKASAEKIDLLRSNFDVSEGNSLATDIDRHDVIVTVHSTAVCQGVVQGKLPAVLELPWGGARSSGSEFEPFQHEHVVSLDAPVDLEAAAEERSTATQREFLDRFFAMPEAGSTALAADEIRRLAGVDPPDRSRESDPDAPVRSRAVESR